MSTARSARYAHACTGGESSFRQNSTTMPGNGDISHHRFRARRDCPVHRDPRRDPRRDPHRDPLGLPFPGVSPRSSRAVCGGLSRSRLSRRAGEPSNGPPGMPHAGNAPGGSGSSSLWILSPAIVIPSAAQETNHSYRIISMVIHWPPGSSLPGKHPGRRIPRLRDPTYSDLEKRT